jgi:hypothetical protein
VVRGRRQQHLCRFHPKLVFVNMSHTTQNTLYTSNCGGRRTIDRNSVSFMSMPIVSSPPLQAWGILPMKESRTWRCADAQSFRFAHQGQELSANDTIWASAIVTDRSLMRHQDHPDIKRDKLLERLIDIGVYDRGDRLDLNNDPAEKRSFRYAAVLMNMLWDQVHDLESEVCFRSGTALLLY